MNRKLDKVYTRALGFFITQAEELKYQINVAQCNEIARVLPTLLKAKYTQKAILEWIYKKQKPIRIKPADLKRIPKDRLDPGPEAA